MDEQRQDDQLEPICNSSVLIQDVALNTSRERWTIETGGERGLERSMLVARHDDDDYPSAEMQSLYSAAPAERATMDRAQTGTTFRVRVDLGVIMKGYSTLSSRPELDPHHQMQFNVLPRTPVVSIFQALTRRCP